MAANQVDFKILPSDQFSVYSPQTRSDKVITYFTLLSKLRGDILSVGQDDDPNNIVSAFYSSVGGTQTLHLVKADGSEVTASVSEPTVGTVTSVDLTAGTAISVSGGPITTSGSITVTNTAPDQVVVLTGAGTTSISGTYPSFTITSNDEFDGTVTSVGLTMPAAFSVAGSPVTASGTLAVTAAGLSSQYIRGDGQLANFPTPGGGGSSVNYYLNGSVSQGTFGGVTYYELSKIPIAGAGTNFTRTSASGDGYVASFITDANDPDQINIPGGNFNLEFYFNSSSSGGAPAFYGELYKVSVSNVFTLIASGSANVEVISGGTAVDQYYTSIAVPQTALLSTDRLAIRVYVIVGGRNITLHTENSNFSEVITTFSTGLNSLNGLSDQVQYFAVGNSGTDFAISSSLDTHTFNLPTASATNRGALSSADWTTFNSKEPALTKGNLTEATSAVLTITGGTGSVIGTGTTIQVAQAGVSTSGFLSSADWNTFNGKQGALIFSAPLVNTSGTVSIPAATGLVDGYLSAANFATFNGKQDALTLTTTGITGAATLIGATLNIPNYADQFTGTVTSVDLTAGTGITVSGGPITASGFITVTNNDRGSSQNIFKNIAVAGQSTIVADVNDDTLTVVAGSGVTITTNDTTDTLTISATGSGGTVTSVDLTAGTGISVSGGPITGSGSITVNNTAPDQTVVLTASTGITTSGTYPNFTIANSAPDQTVVLTAGTGITTSGTYPNFTVTNSAPDQTVVLTAGTGITTSGTYPSFTVTNSAPDQTVALTAGTGISISGTYPSFTITNTSAGGGTITGSGTTNYVPKWTSASAIGDSSIFDNGNVGIGTTSPTTKLQVEDGFISTYHNINANGAGYGIQFFTNGGGSKNTIANIGISQVGTARSGDMFFSTSNAGDPAIRLTIASAGNVGIGTTGPVTRLEVYGGHSNTTARLYSTGDGSGLDASLDMWASEPGVTYDGSGIGNNVNGHPYYGRRNTGIAQSYIRFYAGQILLNTGSTTASQTVTVLASGNVGIGTTAPNHLLSLFGTPVSDGDLKVVQKISSNAASSTTPRSGLGFGANYTTGGDNAVLSGIAGGKENATSGNFAGVLTFFTRPNGGDHTERMRITSAGNVGIGTTSPSYKLEVNGLAAASRYILNSVPTSGFEGSLTAIAGDSTYNILAGPANGPTIRARWSGGTVDRYLEFGSTDNAGSYFANVRIVEGNVGIGTTSPSYKLDVTGDARINTGALGVNIAPSATDGRIDASNDIVAFSSSDLRLKENIKPIENALEKVKSLTGVEFDWKPELKHAHGYEGHDTGVIAQEVQEVMPTAIRTNDTGYLAVRYEKLIGLLIEANKELAARVEELESKLK